MCIIWWLNSYILTKCWVIYVDSNCRHGRFYFNLQLLDSLKDQVENSVCNLYPDQQVVQNKEPNKVEHGIKWFNSFGELVPHHLSQLSKSGSPRVLCLILHLHRLLLSTNHDLLLICRVVEISPPTADHIVFKSDALDCVKRLLVFLHDELVKALQVLGGRLEGLLRFLRLFTCGMCELLVGKGGRNHKRWLFCHSLLVHQHLGRSWRYLITVFLVQLLWVDLFGDGVSEI